MKPPFHALGACLTDLLLRSTTGLKRSTMSSMSTLEMVCRFVPFALLYPVMVLVNVVAPVFDRLLPVIVLPVHYLFVYEKPVAERHLTARTEAASVVKW